MNTENKEKLLAYQLSKEHVFHGSGELLSSLEPRQAYNYSKNRKPVKDGKPAIFASLEIEVSIFMAIFNKQNAPKGFDSGFSFYDNILTKLRATKKSIEQVRENGKGYVYIFDRKDFQKKDGGSDWVSYISVVPIDILAVVFDDIGHEITLVK